MKRKKEKRANSPNNHLLVAWIRNNEWLRRLTERAAKLLPYRARENVRQRLLRSTHDPDFLLFDLLRDVEGLLLDVGANRGVSALSVLNRTRQFRVLSLEPNRELFLSLALVQCFYPLRFRFRLIGADSSNRRAKLIVPTGEQDFSPQGSMDNREFEKKYVISRLQADGHDGSASSFRTMDISVMCIDALEVMPDFVKIDVEGWEANVLTGMDKLLHDRLPALMIELNNQEKWAPNLESIGYFFHHYENGKLVRHSCWQEVTGINVICLHPNSLSVPSRLLWDACHGQTRDT